MAEQATALAVDVTHSFRAMASTVNLRVVDPLGDVSDRFAAVQDLFSAIERACTRFNDSSDLMRANAEPGAWTTVAPECFAAVRLAFDAHLATEGAFDPRILDSLTTFGYDRSLDFESGSVTTATLGRPDTDLAVRESWQPEFDDDRSAIRLGDRPIDLGGIGKGYAVRCGIELLRGAGTSALVEAGGDLATYGPGPHRDAGVSRCWRVSVEDPRDGSRAIAVLDASDAGVATSSIRLRSWRAGERQVHHLIDPRTGEPAESGLLAVTVVADDPAWAEVWTKACFLAGSANISKFAGSRDLAALWVNEDGRIGVSDAMNSRVLWRADHE